MHRLPELLVAVVAALVLCVLLVFLWLDIAPEHSPDRSDEKPMRVFHVVPEATIAPLKILSLPPSTLPEAGRSKKPLPQNVLTNLVVPSLLPALRSIPAADGLIPITLVLDDCGIVDGATRAAIELPAAVTLTFLPYGRNSAALARSASSKGHDILLHMPMQPFGHDDPGPDALTVGLTEHQITQRVQDAFAAMPPVIGLNNHMGSRFTSDSAGMQPVIQEIKKRKLFFLDSVTSAKSVAAATARAAGVPTLARDVFLDDVVSEAEVVRELAHAEAIARKRGSVIAIGHPHASTLKVLNRWLVDLKQRGFKLVALHTLLPHAP